jgi:hypothetical protein
MANENSKHISGVKGPIALEKVVEKSAERSPERTSSPAFSFQA